jgi:hypothetical protein
VTLDLPYGAMLPIANAKGVRIACLGGALWVTQDDDRSDAIVEPGSSFQVSRAGKTIIVALRDSRVALHSPTPAQLSFTYSLRA